jgi:hypothetical protein
MNASWRVFGDPGDPQRAGKHFHSWQPHERSEMRERRARPTSAPDIAPLMAIFAVIPAKPGIRESVTSRPSATTPSVGTPGRPPQCATAHKEGDDDRIPGLIRSPFLPLFWHCGQRQNSSRTGPERRPGNEPSMVLAEDLASIGSGNADSQRKARSSGWSGQGCFCSPGCVRAHPASWRASASYRPLRAVWAFAPGHSGVSSEITDPSAS